MLKKRYLVTLFAVIVLSFFAFHHLHADTTDPNSDPGPGSIPDGSSSNSSTSATSGWAGGLAFDPDANVWLVVSNTVDGDQGGTSKRIFGRMMKSDGTAAGDQFRIAQDQFEPLAPRVAYIPDQQEFFVAWINAADSTWYGQFVKPDGTLVGAPSKIIKPDGVPFPTNSGQLQYDAKNKKIVLAWEDRFQSGGIYAYLTTYDVSAKAAGSLIKVTTGGEERGGTVAVNNNSGEYCVGYTITGNPKYPNNAVAVRAINAANGTVGPESIISTEGTLVSIAYNSDDDGYLFAYTKSGPGSYAVTAPDCSSKDPDPEFQVQESATVSAVAYNPTSDTYAFVGQDQDDSGNLLTIIDANGNTLYETQLFPDGSKGNFAPATAANTTTGTYAATSSQNYATTRFQTGLGAGELPSAPANNGPIPPPVVIPPQNEGLPTDIGKLIQAIFNWSLAIIGLVIFARFFYAGFLWFTANGSTQRIGQAQTIMKNALFGTALLFSSYLILNTINPDFVSSTLKLPGLPGVNTTDSGGGGTIPPPDKSPSHLDIVKAWRAKYPANMTGTQIVEMLRGIAADINKTSDPDKPFGILKKPGDPKCNNYSCDIICSGQTTQQRQYDVLGDSDPGTGKQTPSWSFVSPIAVRDCEIAP